MGHLGPSATPGQQEFREELNAEAGYTKQALVGEARRAGYDIDEKTVDRWVTAGLLDHAIARGRGKSLGVERTWPETQLRLLLTLLGQHGSARYLPTLTNVPVITWVLWGDDLVPLRQVRRALETFASINPGRRPYRGRAWARELVTRIARPGATGYERSALASALLDALEHDDLADPSLARLFSTVVGPPAPAEQADGPRMLSLVQAQWAARARFHELTDGHFRWARTFMLAAQADYSVTGVVLAADPRFGHLHSPFTFQTMASQASHSLLTILGLGLTLPLPPGYPDALQLEPWLQGRARLETTIAEEYKPGRVRALAGFGVDVRVTIEPLVTAGTT